MIHDYFEYQPSAAEIQELSEKRADAGRRGGLAKAKQLASGPLKPVPSRPVPTRDRDIEFSDEEEIPVQRVEQIGFPSYGMLGGSTSLKVARLCPIFGWELRKSMSTPGKSWAYFAKVVESIREEAAKPKPPAGARKTQLRYVAPLDRNGIPIPRPQESAK